MWPFGRRDAERRIPPPGDATWYAPDVEQRAITSVPWGQGWSEGGTTYVTAERALSLAPVYGCARVLADTISSLPVDLYRRSGKDQIQLPTPSLFVQPAVNGTLFDWVHRAITSLALRGNAFGLITARDYLGFATMIEWLNPNDVMVTDSLLQGPGSFLNPLWYVGGRPVPSEDIFHIPWFTLAWHVLGLSPLGLFASSINTGIASGQYTLDWYQNGGVPPGTMQNTESTLTREEADIITSRVTTRIREHKPLVLGRDWTYTPIAVNPREARFVESAHLTATQIATIYGVDPLMVGGTIGNSMNYTSTEQMNIRQLTYTFGPWIGRLESALSTLFPRGTFVKFNVDSLLRTDAATRWNVYKTAVEIGAMTINEIRALEDMPPMPGGDKVQQVPSGQQAQPPVAPPGEAPTDKPPVQAPNGNRPAVAAPSSNGKPTRDAPLAEVRQHYLPPDPWRHLIPDSPKH